MRGETSAAVAATTGPDDEARRRDFVFADLDVFDTAWFYPAEVILTISKIY